jgi:predicted nucleotidyltransferase
MHEILTGASVSLGIDLPNIAEAADLSARVRGQASELLKGIVPPIEAFDVLVMGSLAREELTANSDFDTLVVAFGLPTDVSITKRLLSSLTEVGQKLGLNRPGATRMFGRVVAAPDLTERIGLEDDTNVTHSRRILVLQESISIYQPDLRIRLVEAILDRYLIDYKEDKPGVARFLLNDILRYWRTIAVDYQAKRWEQLEPDWGLRYLKLRISRKLTFAGTLVSVLLPYHTKQAANARYFREQFDMPALARLAQIYPLLDNGSRTNLATALTIADEFCNALGNEAFRTMAASVEDPSDMEREEEFAKWHMRSDELQMAIEQLFFRSECLRDASIRYSVF